MTPAPAVARVEALDGLRGIAILLVLLHHFNLASHATGIDTVVSNVTGSGWIGVDLFFVLSGYLITGILWRTRSAAHYFRNFYARRTLRIFPLYYAFVASMLIVLTLLVNSYPTQVATTLANQAWIWTYTTNILLAIKGDWTQAAPAFNHFWSLAVEEQFYLIWPAVIWLAPHRGRMIRIALGMVLLAPVIRMAF